MSPDPSAYRVEAGPLDPARWADLLGSFDDATIYQTHEYGRVRWGAERLVHVVLWKCDQPAAAAQVIVRKIPGTSYGIAYVPWGPLWRPHGKEADIEVFRAIVRELSGEFARRRGLLLRIRPGETDTDGNPFVPILHEEGYRFNSTQIKHRTLLLSLAGTLEDIRKNFDQKWRNQLNRAEKNDLEVQEGTEDDLYRIFLDLVQEMLVRKGFDPGVDYAEFQKIQSLLPEAFKMRIFVCREKGIPISCTIGSALGDTGFYLLGATSDSGMQSKGSYLLQWHLIQWLKARGCKWYDLGGINPEGNPGVYHFKQGCAGKSGQDVHHLGQYEVCLRPLNRILLQGIDSARRALHRIRKRKG